VIEERKARIAAHTTAQHGDDTRDRAENGEDSSAHDSAVGP
jgi:hypothetical protein